LPEVLLVRNERVPVSIELRRPGKDGRVRLIHPRPEQERTRLIELCHQSQCELHLSYRQTQRRLEEYGGRVSLGQVFNWIKDFECSSCADPPPQPPDQLDPPCGPPEAPRHRGAVPGPSGYLTSQLLGGGDGD
jgi:hypothetical protein